MKNIHINNTFHYAIYKTQFFLIRPSESLTMQKSCENALSEHKNSSLDEFLDNVVKFNEKQSQRFLNERFKKFRQAYAFEAKALPSPKEISAAIDSNFSKFIIVS